MRGNTRKEARAGCLAVAFRADTKTMGMLGIHMRNCLEIACANILLQVWNCDGAKIERGYSMKVNLATEDE